MQPGNLVKIKRSGIGRPAGTLALCLSYVHMNGKDKGTKIFHVELMGYCKSETQEPLTARYLEGDLELVS